MIDWDKPLETVPDESNPAPVPCRRDRTLDVSGENNSEEADRAVFIEGDWFGPDVYGSGGGYTNRGNDHWYFTLADGDPKVDWLPRLRNVEAA